MSSLKKPKFLAVDFFCGAGGTTCGLIDAGGYVIAGIDKDSKCARTYTENNHNVFIDEKAPEFLERDVFPKRKIYPQGEQKRLFDELENLINYYRDKTKNVPLLFAICAPCQPFTKLSRKELSEERKKGRARDSNLLLEAVKFVRRFQPEMILAENVAGINEVKYGEVWNRFRKKLEKLGYAIGSKIVCTSRFGIPQHRKRSILIAVKVELARSERLTNSSESELLIPEIDPDAALVSVKKAIGHLPPLVAGEAHPTIPNHRTRNLNKLNLNRIKSAAPGESNAYLTNTRFGDLTLDCHRRASKRLKVSCFSDVYTRMHPERPSPTITTKCHSISNGRFGHYDIKQARGISLREAAILQSFPENYVFFPTEQTEPVARMIGNAVPPKLASFFANYLVDSVISKIRA